MSDDTPLVPAPPLADFVATLQRIAELATNPEVRILAMQFAEQLERTLLDAADRTTAVIGHMALDTEQQIADLHQEIQRLAEHVGEHAREIGAIRKQGDMTLKLLQAMKDGRVAVAPPKASER